MVISITCKDIDDGNTSIDACPITIALRRQFGNNKISVSRDFIRIPKKRTKNQWKLISLPKEARNFILNYYSNIPAQPFSFVLPKKNVSVLKG